MNIRQRLLVISMVSMAGLIFVLGWFGGVSAAEEEVGPVWLSDDPTVRTEQIERQFRGMDMAMVEIGYRFTELYFAGRDGNWDYAVYQAEKMEKALNNGLERRPKRAASALAFLDEAVPAMHEAVQKKDPEQFMDMMTLMRASCMKCHVAEKLPYFTVEMPEYRVSPIRTIQP